MQSRNLIPLVVLSTVLSWGFVARQFPALAGVRVVDGVIAVAAVLAVARLFATHSLNAIPLRYLAVFLAFCYVVGAGFVLNGISPDVAVAGVRAYFKYVPLFLLPFAFRYTPLDIRNQALVMLGFGLLQIPLSLWQRFVQFRYVFTGDSVSGTLSTSNSLSFMSVAAVICVLALFVRRRIALGPAVWLAVALFIPATLNETKITPIFLCIGLLALGYVARERIALRQAMAVAAAAGILLLAFVAGYDALYTRDDGSGYLDLMSSKERMIDNYNMTGARADTDEIFRRPDVLVGIAAEFTTDGGHVGRIDALRMPFQSLFAHDPLLLAFGLGAGNVDSSFGRGGAYQFLEEHLRATATGVSHLVWETGVLGAVLHVALLVLIARDAAALSRREDAWGTIGTAWFAIAILMLSTLAYNSAFHVVEVAVLFSYFSGLVVAQQVKERQGLFQAPAPSAALMGRDHSRS